MTNVRRKRWRLPAFRSVLMLLPVLGALSFGFCAAIPSESKPKASSMSRQLQTGLARKKLQQELHRNKKGRYGRRRKNNKVGGKKAARPSSAPPPPTSSSSSAAAPSISVEAFLISRRVSLRILLRVVCCLFIVLSLLKCLHTRGLPYIRTVWQILYGNEDFTGLPPSDYVPSSADIHLANLLTASSRTSHILLPSPSMPSAGPILGLTASVFAYVGLTYLIPYWSTRFRVFLDYCRTDTLAVPSTTKTRSKSDTSKRRRQLEGSALIRIHDGGRDSASSVTSRSDERKYLIRPLYQSTSKALDNRAKKLSSSVSLQDNFEHPSSCYFEVSQSRIYCDPQTRTCTDGAPMLTKMPLMQLRQLVRDGGLSKQQRKMAQERYAPYNTFDLKSPTLRDAFWSRLSSPLVVIQFLGKLMSVIEEGRGAMFALVVSLVEHYWDARQAIQSAKQMAKEVKTNLQDTSGYRVLVYSCDKDEWIQSVASDLVPGDVFRLESVAPHKTGGNNSTDELIVPVDALVLEGQCLANEAVLTGESVPQIKVPLEFREGMSDIAKEGECKDTLDVNSDRSSILFAGTTLLRNGQSSSMGKNSTGLVCLALRTGTYSSKGQLLRVLKGTGNVGGISNDQADKDAMRLIASLSAFAAISCASLFVRRDGKVTKVSPFRRVIQCTRIVLAGIPSSLPLAMAAVARSCSRMLRTRADVVCSQPGSLLTAAYVDTVVFDKTGTLTADTQSLAKVVSPSHSAEIGEGFHRCLLAGCHSLVHFIDADTNKHCFVGDPLDNAGLRFSGWKYNQTSGFFYLPPESAKLVGAIEPVRLWQIRTFPFDPSRRLSTTVVLIERKDSSLELWRLTKGAPDTLKKFIAKSSCDSLESFEKQSKQLERDGYRSIAMGAENLTKSPLHELLFPEGLSVSPEELVFARSQGERLHRDDVESLDSTGPKFSSCGFSCFDASLRCSSRRIVRELKQGGLACIMLTGDSLDAALNVAKRADIVSTRSIATLELSEPDRKVFWRIRDTENSQNEEQRRVNGNTEDLTVKSIRKFLKLLKNAKLSLLATGDALEHILNNPQDDAHRMILRNLGSISVIARATPNLKKRVVEALKWNCGKTVMMCGDGVNDVAAIQAADVATALLGGFGAETDQDGTIDIDDERRFKKLNVTNIGSNRRTNTAKGGRADLNDSMARIKKKIEKSSNEIKEKMEMRQRNSEDPQYKFDDIKEFIAATFQAYRDEMNRAKKLQKGGGEAAQILAEDRKIQRAGEEDGLVEVDELIMNQNIKPGEVSLVSSFSCLHPSVDGVDAILREGVATAAAALATQQLIGLHSLMSAFHLATLYRDGFRYSDKMWFAEVFLSMNLDAFRYGASCLPRPRLPTSVLCRPSSSIFETGSLLSTILQAVSHLLFMSWGVSYARKLQESTTTSKVERIGIHNLTPFGTRLDKFVNVLSASPLHSDGEDEKKPFVFFRRPPFRPNYETNVVFMFSVLQGALSAIVNHQGKPYYHSVLESRAFCRMLCFTAGLFLICVTESMPDLTNFLNVKPFPTWQSKLVIIGLAIGNVVACILSRWIATRFVSTTTKDEPRDSDSSSSISGVAADLEETLLREEAEMNARGVKLFLGLLVYLLVDILVDATKAPGKS